MGEVNNPMRLLSYRRWLTVEDGTYDQAHLWANDQLMWRNPATRSADQHTLDQRWTLHEVDLLSLDDPTQLQFHWTLASDGGLEFGGWALDDVCIVQLADLEGHYRVRDLVATDDQESVQISWTQPWIDPLFATALVRKIGGVPESLADGVVVDLDVSPQYGESIEVTDSTALPGQQYYYAVFTATGPGQWVLQSVEGQNWDTGSTPAIPGDPSGEPPSSFPPIMQHQVDPCGCAIADRRDQRSQIGWLLALLGWISFRRRVHHQGIK